FSVMVVAAVSLFPLHDALPILTGIIGESEPMMDALERVVQVASVNSTVLVTGESGTGKERIARGIHMLSPRRNRAFIAANVAALDRKSTRLNSSHVKISYAVFC